MRCAAFLHRARRMAYQVKSRCDAAGMAAAARETVAEAMHQAEGALVASVCEPLEGSPRSVT